jgi:hypothetical protein
MCFVSFQSFWLLLEDIASLMAQEINKLKYPRIFRLPTVTNFIKGYNVEPIITLIQLNPIHGQRKQTSPAIN